MNPLTEMTAPHVDLLFTGEVFCDIVFGDVDLPRAGEEVFAKAFALTPGGSANGAVAAARLGATSAVLAEIGDDSLGTTIREMLCDEPGLLLDWLVARPGFQSPVTVSLTGAAERSFVTYVEKQTPLEWPVDGPSVGAILIGAARPLSAWVKRLRDHGTRVYGGASWTVPGRWSSAILDGLRDLDVVVLNEKEAAEFTGADSAADAARLLGEYVELAVITRGKDGSVAFESSTGRTIVSEPEPVVAVDPTGAGDVFLASLMASQSHGWTIDDRLRFAGLCASLSVRTLGGAAGAPRRPDIADYLASAESSYDWSAIHAWASLGEDRSRHY